MQWSRLVYVAFIGAFLALRVFAGPAMTDEGEPNGSFAQATPITGFTAVIEGKLSPSGDVDFFSFTADKDDRIFVATMTGLSPDGNDTVLDVIDADQTTVLETDSNNGKFSDSASSIAGLKIPKPATYYIRLRRASGSGEVIPYRLFFQRQTVPPAAEVEIDSVYQPQPLPRERLIAGEITGYDQDGFSIDLKAGDTVFISLDEDPERDGVELPGFLGFGPISSSFTFLGAGDGGGPGPDSQAVFMTVPTAGTYLIGIEPNTNDGGTYTYVLSVAVFPADDEGVHCTTYTSADVLPIATVDNASMTSTITVPAGVTVRDVDVMVKIHHSQLADLDVTLTSPAGTVVPLFADVGADPYHDVYNTFDDEAGIPYGYFDANDGFTMAPQQSYRLSWFDGEDAAGTWTLTVYDDTANGSTGQLLDWSLRICEPIAPCNAGYSQVEVFASDFESGAAGFTHSGTADEWQLGLPSAAPITTCNSGTHCWKTDLNGTYSINSDQDLLSPLVDLSSVSGPVFVEWAQKYQMESAVFDHFFVDAREAASPGNRIRLFQHDGPTMQTSAIGDGSTLKEAAGWATFRRRIDPLAGKIVELRFHIDSDAATNLSGAAIDDVRVVKCVPKPLPVPGSFVATAQSSTKITLTWDAPLNADAYDIERRSADAPSWTSIATGVVDPTYDDTVVSGKVYVYHVRATAASFPSSDFSKPDVATTYPFDDEPVVASIIVRKEHVNQLRTAIDLLRTALGLPGWSWSDNPVDNTVRIKTQHMTELRDAVNDARVFIGMDAFVFATDPTIVTQTTRFKAPHINELRDSLR